MNLIMSKVRGWFGRAVFEKEKTRKPYSQWENLPKRPRGESVDTRQCIRADMRRAAMENVNARFGAEPRKARRNMARAFARADWQARRLEAA